MKTAKAAWILLVLIWIGLYWPMLAGRVPAFRDAFHFYYPLEYWLDQQAQQGDFFPQFNPMDGTGANLPGEMSTGLFYPLRILWWLPILSVGQRTGLLYLVHTCIAGMGAAYAARRMQLGSAPQLLAAAAYSLSGPVLFQHVNQIFLFSAAWLPWALAECWILSRPLGSDPRVRWHVWIIACSLMILAGDPEATVNVGIVTALSIAVSIFNRKQWSHAPGAVGQLAGATLVVAGLTAIQVLPTWYWFQLSAPNLQTVSHTVDATLPALLRDIKPVESNVARGSAYAYSVAPWHFVTLLWSNLLGHVVPNHSRWIMAWNAEPRMWIPSLSVGIATILLALSTWRLRANRSAYVFLWLLVLLAGTAMLGNHSPTWILRNALRWFSLRGDWLPNDEVGGIYWCLAKVLPGYEAFRYPAKWSPLFVAGIVMLAAQALEQWPSIENAVLRAVARLNIVSIILLLAVFVGSRFNVVEQAWREWLASAPPDPWLGSIQWATSLRVIESSLSFAVVVCLLLVVFTRKFSPGARPWCLVFAVALELAMCAPPWLVTVPAPQAIGRAGSHEATEPVRVWSAVGLADVSNDVSPRADLSDKLRYQQTAVLGKLHLLETNTSNLCAFMTLTPAAQASVRHHLAQYDRMRVEDPQLDAALAWLGVQRRLVRDSWLRWQPVPGSAPLIEFDSEPTAKNTLHVKYLSADRIVIDVNCSGDAQVIVRQFQDGGWRARLTDLKGATHSQTPVSTHLGLFQTLNVSPGDWQVELSYEAPGLRLGLIITCVTFIAFSFFVTQSARSLESSL